ncbi:phenylalanine--tRNA ligase subunit alpha [soil metagenome]
MDFDSLSAQLEELRSRALTAVADATDVGALAAVDSTYLGKRGEVRTILSGIGALAPADRPRVGAVANTIRSAIEKAAAQRREELERIALEARLAAEWTDVTLPGRSLPRGSLHPLIETQREIMRIFGQFGFVAYEGPQVETDVLNFEALNIPAEHPARDLWDTLYLDDHAAEPEGYGSDGSSAAPTSGSRYLLRTHTSPTQIRVMRETEPPIRALMPGRCFRYEAVDASHGFEFYQVEGLMIDEGTSLAHLRGLLDEFAGHMFGRGRRTRFRPGYYPFTEPSVAFDIGCVMCDGAGCPACGRTGWMTILGAGMVHPVVLRNCELDPERYQGFAFGMGPDRIAMLRYGIEDIRYFLENDLRFLEQL